MSHACLWTLLSAHLSNSARTSINSSARPAPTGWSSGPPVSYPSFLSACPALLSYPPSCPTRPSTCRQPCSASLSISSSAHLYVAQSLIHRTTALHHHAIVGLVPTTQPLPSPNPDHTFTDTKIIHSPQQVNDFQTSNCDKRGPTDLRHHHDNASVSSLTSRVAEGRGMRVEPHVEPERDDSNIVRVGSSGEIPDNVSENSTSPR